MADPFGADILSPLARPDRGRVVARRPSPSVARWLRPIRVNTRSVEAKLRGYLNAREPKWARWLVSTINANRDALKFDEIRNALVSEQISEEVLARWRQNYTSLVSDRLGAEYDEAMDAGAGAMREAAATSLRVRLAEYPMTQRAGLWMDQHRLTLAKYLTDSERGAVGAALRHFTVVEPIHPSEAAIRIRAMLGLTERDARSVLRMRSNLAGEGKPGEEIDRRAFAYSQQLTRRRAERIARTEMAFAWNFGGFELMRSAQEDGILPDVAKVWLTAQDERVCQFCGPLNGHQIDLKETYPGATKATPNTFAPPAHPGCRCTLIYQVDGAKVKKPAAPPPKKAKPFAPVSPTAPPSPAAEELGSPRKWRERMRAERAEAIDAYAATVGKPVDAAIADLDARIAHEVGRSHQFVRVERGRLTQIAADRRYRTQFETGTSGGLYDPGKREDFEARFFGTGRDVDPGKRPIYGYLSPSATGEVELAGGNVANYGDIALRLRPEVRRRSSMTFADSLDYNLQGPGQMSAVPLERPTHEAIPTRMFAQPQREIRAFIKPTTDGWEYAETQIHGGLSLGDIEEVIIPSDRTVGSVTLRRLQEAGIKVTHLEEP